MSARLALFATVMTGALLAARPAPAAKPAIEPPAPEQFAGVLTNLENGRTLPLVVHVDSYTPARELRTLSLLLKKRGQDAMEAALFKMKPRGWIRIGSSLGYQVPLISSVPTPSGRRIVVIADRPIQFWEQWRDSRSVHYPFGMIILDLDHTGHGEGRLIAAMQAKFNEAGQVELKSLGTQPFRVIGVAQEALK